MGSLLDFSDRTVVITGAASGIGAATAELLLERGAEIHALDIAPVAAPVQRAHECDMGDPASIDAAVAALPNRVDALFNCAGVPNGGRFTPEEVMRINWLGLRHLTESLLPRIVDGGSVVHVASTAGRGWPERAPVMMQLMAASSFADGLGWVDANLDVCGDGYALSKEAVQYYTLSRSLQTRQQGVRINSICPGVTNTALVDDFRRGVSTRVLDRAISIAGRMAEPSEMAPALLFLADDASSSYINGVNLNIDSGTGAAHATGTW